MYENGFLIKNNLERQLQTNEMTKYAKGRQSTRSCLKISESLYNLLELVAKDNITNEKAIVVANKDRKRKRKPKVPGKGNSQIFHPKFSALKNDPEERSEVSEFSSAMVSGDAVVNKKEDLSEATYAHTDSAMKNPERSPSGNSNF